MVHKSDLSWTIKVNVPGDLVHKGDDVEAIILSINHDEKKVSLGVKQLWDDPWPNVMDKYKPGVVVEAAASRVMAWHTVAALMRSEAPASTRQTVTDGSSLSRFQRLARTLTGRASDGFAPAHAGARFLCRSGPRLARPGHSPYVPWRGLVTSAALILLLLLAGIGASSWFAVQANVAVGVAKEEAKKGEAKPAEKKK